MWSAVIHRRAALVTTAAAATLVGLGLLALRVVLRTSDAASQAVRLETSGSSPDAATVAAGRAIYRRGEGPSQHPITALLSPGEDPVPAAVVPCAGCHGKGGRGRPEGGVVPADLTPEVLGVPRRTAGDHPGRPAYTPALLKRAITMGLDAGGRPLEPTMPRFQMSLDDLAALVSYLPRLGHEPEPGLTDEDIRVAVVGSPAAQRAARGYFDAVARAGGVYRRSIVVGLDGEPVLAGIGGGSDRTRLVDSDEEIPWLDGAPPREPGTAPERSTFHLFPSAPGLDDATLARAEAMVLVEALRQCGREVTRERLVQALETVHRFDGELGAPLSFSRGRHIGMASPTGSP